MGKIKSIILKDSERLALETGFRQGDSHCFRMRCRAVLLKSTGLSSKAIGLQTEMSHVSVNSWVKRFLSEGIDGLQTRPGRGRKPIMDCTDEEVVRKAIEQDRQSSGSLAEGHWQGSERPDIQAFFISLGARYKRIRKRPRGVPSPQLYAYKTEKLQELEHLNINGKIDLYYADESHVCTEGYVPYGWQFRNEDVYIPSQKAQRVNIFGMIDRNNRYHGFTTTESIDADKVVEYLDTFSLNIKKDTFIVLDNASVHRNKKIKELRELWEKRGLFLFYLPPYSPHLNLAETLWRIMKTKWIRPQDYASSDNLFYTVNRALAAVGDTLGIKLKHNAA